jgi:hypothetical protein
MKCKVVYQWGSIKTPRITRIFKNYISVIFREIFRGGFVFLICEIREIGGVFKTSVLTYVHTEIADGHETPNP